MNLGQAFTRLLDSITAGRRSPAERLFASFPQWPACQAVREMKQLLKLSKVTADREEGQKQNGVSLARRCVSSSRTAASYHSRMLLREPGAPKEGGASADFMCVWLIDFAKPANFRVTQATGGEGSHNDFDRWATIGEQHFEWIMFQLGGASQPGANHRNNQFLTIDKWLELLARSEAPAQFNAYRAHGRRFVLLEYQASEPSGVLVKELAPEMSGYRETVHAWVDQETGRLAKGVLEATVQLRSGAELPPIRLQQIFAGYDHEMYFDPGVPFPELKRRAA